MQNRVRQQLAAGKTVTGILVFTGSPMVVELAAAGGLDFVILDMEHSPLGLDGAGHLIRAAGYRRGEWNAYATRANRDTMAIALIEDTDTLRDFESVAAIPGIDAYFVGPSDLSVALGVPRENFDDPTMGKALDTVIEATRRHHKFAMTLIGNKLDVDYGKRVAARGVQIIVLDTDVDLFVDSVTRLGRLKA